MYALVYLILQNNSVAEMRVKLYEDWRRASRDMQQAYEDRLSVLARPEWKYKSAVSCTLKEGDTTYDWSIIMPY